MPTKKQIADEESIKGLELLLQAMIPGDMTDPRYAGLIMRKAREEHARLAEESKINKRKDREFKKIPYKIRKNL